MNKQPLILNEYKKATIPVLRYSFPHLTDQELERAVDYSIEKRLQDTDAYVYNNYTETKYNMSLLSITDYILSREPILTTYGVMFKKHANAPNLLSEMIQGFLENRAKEKKKMFKYPKGSEDFEKHNLLQQLYKIDANGTYGALGQHTCLFYNLYVAASITTQGRSLISAASLQFEMFLNNNCKFSSFNEVITFINNVLSEKSKRKYNDRDILDNDVSVEDCFCKLIMTCGFDYIPTEEDMNILWNLLLNMKQEDINRVYYKNNLYEFCNNEFVSNMIILLLQKLDLPYVDPNEPPESIKAELDEFTNVMMEYVYYSHQIIDRLEKYDNMYRSVSIITDTDSSIISLDGWYHYVLNKTYGVDMKLKHQETDAVTYIDILNGDEAEKDLCEEVEVEEYSFYDEDVITVKRAVNNNKIIPQDGLRYSIINIMAYCLTKLINNYMEQYIANSYATKPDGKCKMILKNEFLFRRVLLTIAKKNYASIQEIQEGNSIPEEFSLDVKGLPMNKSTLNKEVRNRLKDILYNDVLNTDSIDQIRVLKSIAKLEKDIFDSLHSGDKKFYKPLRIRSINSYANPMSIQGIKASVVYNATREQDMEIIDLNEINSIDVIKVNINRSNIESIKDTHKEVYNKIIELLAKPEFKGSIESIAMPLDEPTPEWILNFIDYDTIISDNIVFPLSSLGIYEGKANYTNIIKL